MTYLGLRPGEKLYEELLVKTEELDKTEKTKELERQVAGLCGTSRALVDVITDHIAQDSYQINITNIDAEHDRSMREVYGRGKLLRE